MNALLEQAIAHYQRGETDQAQGYLSKVLTQEPLNSVAWHLRGVLALQTARFPEAVEHLRRAAAIEPGDCPIHVNLAAALSATSQFQQAEQVLKHAISLNPQFPEAHFQMGACSLGLGRRDDAKSFFSEALRLRPDWPLALELLADTLFQLGEHEAAMKHAQRALELEPNRAMSHRVVADGHQRRHHYDEALKHYTVAVTLAPNDGLNHCNYALLLSRLGRNDDALAEYRKAVALAPKLQQAREGLAYAMLAAGQLRDAWPHYHARFKAPDSMFVLRKGPPVITDLARLPGKTMLAWVDQGVGDQIMFANLIPELVATGAKVTVECTERLVPLFQRSFPTVPIRPIPYPPEIDGDKFDYQLYLPDAMRWFRNEFTDFPCHHGYLKADEALTRKLRQSYLQNAEGKPVIGISWRTATDTKVSVQKTLELEAWAPLLSHHPDATFVSLQYGSHSDEIAAASRKFGRPIIYDASVDPLQDMDTFAAQVAAMDLVITTSNATAHMAGSLNIPTWVLVPKGNGALWHWFLEREDSPWYPSVRLFRQMDRGDWQPVLTQAAAALTEFIAEWRR